MEIVGVCKRLRQNKGDVNDCAGSMGKVFCIDAYAIAGKRNACSIFYSALSSDAVVYNHRSYSLLETVLRRLHPLGARPRLARPIRLVITLTTCGIRAS